MERYALKKYPGATLPAILVTILFWASAFVGIRYAVREYSPESVACGRFIVASVALAFIAVAKKIRLPAPADIPLIMLNGLLGITLYMWLLNWGSRSLPAGTASFIVSAAPVFTALVSIPILGERINAWGWFGILVSFFGIGFINWTELSGSGSAAGSLAVLAAAVLMSFYNIFQRKLLRKYSPLEATIYPIWAGTLFLLAFLPKLAAEMPNVHATTNLVIVFLGIFPAAIAYLLWSFALSKVSRTSYVTSFMYLTPLVTLAIGRALMRELPDPRAIIGGLIVIAGMLVLAFRGK